MSPSDSGFPTGTPLAWDTSASGYALPPGPQSQQHPPYLATSSSPPSTMPPFTSQTTATGYVPGSPEHAHHGSLSGATGEGSSPTVASSRKAFDCPFCLEVGISDGASRISDLRRHFRTKHNTNAQWHCNFVGCHQIFDWQSAYEGHLKKAHPDADKNFVLSPSEAMIPCNIQVIFACGFDTCRKVFETPPDGDASATAKDYFHHVANHFQDGTTTEEWYYTRRIRNLLHQSGVRDTWKALKPRYGTAVPLRWQPHNSTILRKKLECRDAPDSKRLVDLAVVLGSHPFNSPDSPQLPNITGEYAPPMDGMAWRPHTPTVQAEAPSRAHPIRMRSLHGTPSPPIRSSPHMQAPSIAAPHPQGHLASSAPTSHPSGLRMDVDPHPANAVNAPYEWSQSLYQFSGMETMGGFPTPPGVLSMDHGSDEYQPARSQG